MPGSPEMRVSQMPGSPGVVVSQEKGVSDTWITMGGGSPQHLGPQG